MPNYVKEYLVKLGFEADQPAFRRLDQIMVEAEQTVNRHTSGMVKDLLKIQIAIVGGFAAVSGAIVTFADKVAMADQGYRLMGLRMMMTTESARKLDMITKALGTTMEQAAWDPEVHQSWLMAAKRIDDMSESLGFFTGGKGTAALRGIRQFHNAFAMFGLQLKFLGMGFVSSLFQKLFPDGGVAALATVTGWLDKFQAKLPELSDKLSDKAVPILRMTWLIFKDIGEVIKTGALAWTNLIGLVSDDSSIQGSTFSWEKFADALAKVTRFLKRIEDIFIDLEQAIASTATALTLFLHGDLEGAAQHMSVAGAAMAGGAQRRTAAAMVDAARADVASADTPEAKEKAGKRLTAALAAQQDEESSTHWGATALAALPFVGTLGAGAALKTGGKMVGRWIGSGIAGTVGRAAATGGAALGAGGGAGAAGVAGRAAALGSEWILPAAEGAGAGAGIGGSLLGGGLLGLFALMFAKPELFSKYTLDKWFPGNARKRDGAGAVGALGGPAAGASSEPGSVMAAIEAASSSSGVPLSLLTAVAKAESGFNPRAVSPKGAQGLMQIMPGTGAERGMTDPFDPMQSASVGSSYLAQLYRRYGDWRTALIAYNQGPASLAKHGPFPSSSNYADKILQDAARREATSTKQDIKISMGGIYITQPGAQPHQIQTAVANGVRDGLRGQSQFDMAQVSPAWG